MTGAGAAIERLRAAVRAEAAPLAGALGADHADAPAGPAQHAASGPRSAVHRDELELAVEAVHEGYRLHYAQPRALQVDDDDLALLAGDRLYALGLARLAALGDLPSIAELADVISLAAQAHAEQDTDLAAAAWDLGGAVVGWGATPETVGAKVRARSGEPDAAGAMREAARTLAGDLAP